MDRTILRASAEFLVTVGLLFYGLWSFPLSLFGPERARIPGDMGDSRFNNYILEHFHQWATGRVTDYWDAPFMYPYKNTIALSDNLLGTAPLYSAFRVAGFNRESAYQVWILSLFALNYGCCFLVLRAWSGRTVLAACGAYVFAFGIYNIGQMEHAQVFPKFMVPVALWLFWRTLLTARWWTFLLAVVATVYQFYCGIYMGFLLLYLLACFLIAHLIVHRTRSFTAWSRHIKDYLPFFGSVLLGGALLLPLMRPYLEVANTLGTRTFPEVVNTIPRPSSYFFTHPGAVSWRDLSRHSQFAFEEWWSHFHFMGVLPWLAILSLPVLLLSKRIDPEHKRPVLVVGITLLLSIIFCLNVGGFTLYKLLFHLPGFSALRAIDRVINVQAFLFVLMLVLVPVILFRKSWMHTMLSALMPLAIVLDNQVDTGWLKSYDKYDSRTEVNQVARYILSQYDQHHTAVAFTPLIMARTEDSLHLLRINAQLDAMLAGQQLHIPVVNAVAHSYPGNFSKFFDMMDENTFREWCTFSNCSTKDIQPIRNLEGLTLDGTRSMFIRTGSGACISVDPSNRTNIRVDVPCQESQPFLVLSLEHDRTAIMTVDNRFVSAELDQQGQLSASAKRLGNFGLFEMQYVQDSLATLKAFNGRYLTYDTATMRLVASATRIGPHELFRFETDTGR